MAKPNLALIPATIGDKVYSILPSDGVGDFDFDRASTATRINAQGLIEEVASGENRLNYSLLDGEVVGCPHLLLEPQRTNLVTYSEDFSQSDWTKGNTTITSNSLISPNGSLNASTLTDNTANGIHRLRDSVSLSASTDYNLSIFAKKGTLSNIQLALINTANSHTASRVFDLENGILGESLTSGATLIDSKIIDYGNGWYRCKITAQFATTPNIYQVTLATQSSNNSTNVNQVTYDGDGNGNVYLWGAMLEQGSYSTSLINTQGSEVTRLADSCSQTLPSSVFNSYPFSMFAEVDVIDTFNGFAFSLLNKSSSNNYFTIEYYSNKWHIVARPNGSTITRSSSEVLTKGTHKLVGVYTDTNLKLFLNGSLIASGSNTQSFNSSIDSLLVGQLRISGDTGSRNSVRQTLLYNTALTDQEAIALTQV